MAQTSGSSATIEQKNDDGVVCNCNWPAKIVQAWTDENPGRRFYTCRGRKVAYGFENCKFFRWYDVGISHGWQYVAFLDARNTIREQKSELKNLRNMVSAVSREAECMEMENPSELVDELKQTREECEVLNRELLVVREKSRVCRQVQISSSIGFTVVIGVMVAVWKK